MGATMGAHSAANGFSSIRSVSSRLKRQSHEGRDTKRFRRTGHELKSPSGSRLNSPHSVCKLLRLDRSAGRFCSRQPSNTIILSITSSLTHAGTARIGLFDILSSSSETQYCKVSGRNER